MASSNVRYPNVKVKLSGRDGNAYAIMGAVSAALRTAGASKEEIQAYIDESTAGTYVELLQTAMRWVNVR